MLDFHWPYCTRHLIIISEKVWANKVSNTGLNGWNIEYCVLCSLLRSLLSQWLPYIEWASTTFRGSYLTEAMVQSVSVQKCRNKSTGNANWRTYKELLTTAGNHKIYTYNDIVSIMYSSALGQQFDTIVESQCKSNCWCCDKSAWSNLLSAWNYQTVGQSAQCLTKHSCLMKHSCPSVILQLVVHQIYRKGSLIVVQLIHKKQNYSIAV